MLRFTFLVVVACSSHPPPAKHEPTPPNGSAAVAAPAPARDCKQDATELGAFLTNAAKYEGPILQAHRDVHLVKRTDLPVKSLQRAPVIIANAADTTFMGSMIASGSELAERLTALRSSVQSSAILFQLDEATPWGKVVELVTAAQRAGFTAPMFAFMTDAKLTPPPRSPADDKLDAFGNDAAVNMSKVTQLTREIIQPCPALITAFGNVSGVDALVAAIAPAVIECDCKLDLASLRSLIWRVVAVAPTVQVIAFDDTTRDQTLALPKTATWAEASKQLRPDTKGMKLVAK